MTPKYECPDILLESTARMHAKSDLIGMLARDLVVGVGAEQTE